MERRPPDHVFPAAPQAFPAGDLGVVEGLSHLLNQVRCAITVSLDPHRAMHAIRTVASRTGTQGPARTVTELLDILVRRYGFDDGVDQLRSIQ